MIVLGADTHKRSHTIAAVNEATGRVIADATVRVTRRSFDDLLMWARGLDDVDRVWAIEDCRHVSGALERFLLVRGERIVFEVGAKAFGTRQDGFGDAVADAPLVFGRERRRRARRHHERFGRSGSRRSRAASSACRRSARAFPLLRWAPQIAAAPPTMAPTNSPAAKDAVMLDAAAARASKLASATSAATSHIQWVRSVRAAEVSGVNAVMRQGSLDNTVLSS